MCDWVKHFESQCLKYPDNTIVKYNGNNKNISLTYRSLNEKSNQLAHYLPLLWHYFLGSLYIKFWM